jgi:prepilin-type N-terminal cleavage/methylation domain-containing protein
MASRTQHGFSLVESLVALLVVSVALLMGLPLLQQQPGVVRRLDAQRSALRELESTLETLRSGAIPLEPMHLGGGPNQPVLWVDPEPVEPPGLTKVTLRALWQVRGKTYEKRVETLIWRPAP